MSFRNTNVETLTDLLSKKDQSGLKIVRLVQMCLENSGENIFENKIESNIPEEKNSDIGFKPIGTWHPVNQNGHIIFERREQSDSIFWESTRCQIEQKKDPNTFRVCFIGESAALGMFFTPHFSPSIALSHHLGQNSAVKWDVVDLTRSCMNAGGLLATCEASLQLEPDFVVMLAGNNWFSDVIFENDAPISKRRVYADILETKGPAGISHFYKNNLEMHADQIFQRLNSIAKLSSTKFIFALPASNFAHWERECPIYWLGNDSTSKWYELYRIASKALENSCYEEALKIGYKMRDIDGGVAPTSNRIVANSLIALNRQEEAYSYCAAESDYAIMYDQITAFPGTPSFVREKFKKLSSQSNLAVIDLETIFMEYLGTKILDKSLFVDYCHMTPKGIDVAMAPVASYLLSEVTDKSTITWQDLTKNAGSHEHDPFRMSISYFYIALYNIHLNQPVISLPNLESAVELIQKAVNCSEKILDVMELYVQARSCYFGAGFSLSKAGQRLFQLVNSPLDFPVAQAAPGVDALTIEAICTVLERNKRNGFKLMHEYQMHYIRLLDKGVDLTEPLYIERINSVVRLAVDSEISTRRKIPYFKSWWPCSHFSLVSDMESDLELKLSCRTAYDDMNTNNKYVNVLVNNKHVASISVTSKWSKHHLIILKDTLNQGFNRLSLEWPKLAQNEKKQINNLTDRYSMGLKVDMFPVFGEVFSLVLRKISPLSMIKKS